MATISLVKFFQFFLEFFGLGMKMIHEMGDGGLGRGQQLAVGVGTRHFLDFNLGLDA